MPCDIVRLPCGSMSQHRTRCPSSAKAAARLSVVVVLATPPFWFANAMTLALFSTEGSAFFVGETRTARYSHVRYGFLYERNRALGRGRDRDRRPGRDRRDVDVRRRGHGCAQRRGQSHEDPGRQGADATARRGRGGLLRPLRLGLERAGGRLLRDRRRRRRLV